MKKVSHELDRDAGIEAAPSSRTLRTERRRNQIFDAADVVFQRHGFHGASMAQVAAEAKMSVGHIYRYFENKEAVIAAIAERDLQRSIEMMQAMLQDPAGVSAAMLAGVEQGVAQMLDRPSAALFLEVMAEAARNPKVAESVRLQHEATQACAGALIDGGRLANARYTYAQALDLMSLVFTGLRVRAIQDPDARAEDLSDAIRIFIADLIGER